MVAAEQAWSSRVAAALLDNHGVPGDWVTGSRMLDVVLLPVIFAIAFPVLRLLLKKYIYQVSAVRQTKLGAAPAVLLVVVSTIHSVNTASQQALRIALGWQVCRAAASAGGNMLHPLEPC